MTVKILVLASLWGWNLVPVPFSAVFAFPLVHRPHRCQTENSVFPLVSSISSSSSSFTTTRICAVSAGDTNNGGSIRRSRRKDPQDITLYDILGASPKDTPEQLKRRYTALVKSLHPDVNRHSQNDTTQQQQQQHQHQHEGRYSCYELSEINAAWEILGDKKERLRYDRSLQAKEFTQGVEALVGRGIQTAIPWLKKTAHTTAAAVDATAAAVDASAKAAQESAEQAKVVYGIFELEQRSRHMEQRALAEQIKAQKLQLEIDNLPNKRLPFLQDATKKKYVSTLTVTEEMNLTSMEAQRILKNFQLGQIPPVLATDLQSLQVTELEHRESIRVRQGTERASQMAARKLEQAKLAEIQAQRRLEEAQKALLEAQQKHSVAQQIQTQAIIQETESQKTVQKMEQSLQKTQQRVKAGLYQQQELYLDRRSKELAIEKAELEASANKLHAEATSLRNEAKRLEKSQKQQQR